MGASVSHSIHSDSGLPDEGFPDMADDSVGAATQYVYDSTADTSLAFTKMLKQLGDIKSMNTKLISSSRVFTGAFTRFLKASNFHAQRALTKSELITNGVSDDNSAKMIADMIKSASKSNDALVNATMKRELLRRFIVSQNHAIRELGSKISRANLKAYADISIAQKISHGAKMTQQLSKSFVEKAERDHLARAAPTMKLAVKDMKEISTISSKIFPIKTQKGDAVVPPQMFKHINAAYKHNQAAVAHAEHALKLSENARIREIVSARDSLRSAIGDEQDVLHLLQTQTARQLQSTIGPKLMFANTEIDSKLIPAINQFNVINKKVLKIIDPNDSKQIAAKISSQIKNREMPWLVVHGMENRIKRLDFL
jgi:hypothetical protein